MPASVLQHLHVKKRFGTGVLVFFFFPPVVGIFVLGSNEIINKLKGDLFVLVKQRDIDGKTLAVNQTIKLIDI